MKKVIIISLAIFGLGIVSCQKQDIAPNAEGMEVPEWEESARIGDDSEDGDDTIGAITDPNHDNDDPNTGGARIGDDNGDINDDGEVGEITDPNHDNDDPINDNDDPNNDNGKKKKRKASHSSNEVAQ